MGNRIRTFFSRSGTSRSSAGFYKVKATFGARLRAHLCDLARSPRRRAHASECHDCDYPFTDLREKNGGPSAKARRLQVAVGDAQAARYL